MTGSEQPDPPEHDEPTEETSAGEPPAEALSAEALSPEEPATEEVEPDIPWRQLHPSSLFINLLPQTWRTAKGIWPLLLLLFIGGPTTGPDTAFVDLPLILAFFALSISRTVVHFLTLRYRLAAGKMEIKSGLLNRRSRVLDPYRIQNIELVQNPFHKLTGLVELRIETAGDASTEGLLSALSAEEAGDLKDALERLARKRRGQPEAEETSESQSLLSLGPVEVLAYGLSQRSVGTVALLLALGMEAMSLLDPYTTQKVAGELSSARLIGIVILAFAGTWAVSGAQSLLRHHGFSLTLRGQTLVTAEGLLTRRRVEIPQGKVQMIRIDEPFLRRQMGYGTALIETAALGMADGEIRQAEGVIPMIEQGSLSALVQQVSPAIEVDPWSVPLNPAHPRALYRGIIRRLIRSSVLAAIIGALFYPWGLLALALIPAAIPVAWLDWKKQGWLITPQTVIARRGYFTRRTWFITRNKIQSVHLGDTPLMRWHGLVAVIVRVAGSQVQLPDIGLAAGHDVLDDLRETWTG